MLCVKENEKQVKRLKMRKSGAYYDEYVSDNYLARGISHCCIFVGPLKVIATKRKVSYVSTPQLSVDIHVDEECRNRTFHGGYLYYYFIIISYLAIIFNLIFIDRCCRRRIIASIYLDKYKQQN